ncbi:MAG: PKD domain-containing protein, partial [Thermoplasmata archaeon]|nr:PKD domain-containing protein [Thermoplasmata archaeon]
IVNWTWNFDDGTVSYLQNPSHQYAENGTYNVMLTVRDNDGTTDSTYKPVIISNAGPNADFSYSPSNPTDLDVITFTDLSIDQDGSIVNWTWNFDDGTVSYLQNPSHQYAENGTYNVMLIVTDDDGATGSIGKGVTINKLSIKEDTDSDGVYELAIDIDRDNSNGYENYTDPNGNSNAVKSIDGDNDGKIDHFIDTNNDGKPDIYWDPDDGIVTGINTIDIDNDGTNEWVYDSDGDGINDKYYDPDDGRIRNYNGQPHENNPPNKPSNPSPANGSIDIPTIPTLMVTVSDPDGDTLDVSFYWQNGTLIGTKTNVASGTEVNYPIATSLEYNTSYKWYVTVTDGEYQNQSSVWTFTTIEYKEKSSSSMYSLLILLVAILLLALLIIAYYTGKKQGGNRT